MAESKDSSEFNSNQPFCSDSGLTLSPGELFQQYLSKIISDNTKNAYARDILEFYQGNIPEQIEVFFDRSNADSVQNWVNHLIRPQSQGGKGYSERTVRRKFFSIRSFFEYCLDKELLRKNPANLKYSKKPSSFSLNPVYILTNKQFLEIEKNCINDFKKVRGLRDLAIISIGFFCCINCEEIANVSVNDIQFCEEKIILNLRSMKGGQDDTVELSQHTKERIEAYLMEMGGLTLLSPDKNPDGQIRIPVFVSLSKRSRFQRLDVDSVRKIVQRRVEEIGIYNLGEFPQLLRLSGISHLFDIGWSLERIQNHIRREDSKTIQLLHIKLAQLEDSAANALGRGFEND